MTLEVIKTSLFAVSWALSGGYVIKQLIGIWVDLKAERENGIPNFFD